MNNTLVKIQKKNDQEKAAIAMVSAVAVTALLFITWGYNFAHSGKINNLASSVSGVAVVVENTAADGQFNKLFDQMKVLTNIVTEKETQEKQDTLTKDKKLKDTNKKNVNVFVNSNDLLDTQSEHGNSK